MRKSRRLISLILAVVMLCAFIPLMQPTLASAAGKWNATWATSMVNSSISVSTMNFQDLIPAGSTLRTELKITTAGTKIRLKFSNEYGSAPVIINAVSIAATDGEGIGAVKSGTICALTFNKQYTVTIPAGGTVVSDEMNYRTNPLDKITVSMYFQNLTYITTAGLSNGRTFMNTRAMFTTGTSEVYKENLTSPSEITIGSGSLRYHTIPFLSEIDTYNEDMNTQTAVFIGDSTLVNDAYYYYARRVMDTGARNIAVVNEAVIGNKLLNKGTGLIGNLYGPSLISRFNRDALDLPGVKYVFVKVGLNDILHQYTRSMASTTPKVSTADIINGYKKLINLCHAKGVKIYFFSKSPWKGYTRDFLGQSNDLVWTEDEQKLCDELDKWIKSNNGSDGYIDCSALANPADTAALCPSFTPDGAHLTSLGAVALADLVPLKYVGLKKEGRSAATLAGVDPYKEKKQIIEQMKNPTTAPTEAPTQSPTQAPTEAPTQAPTQPVQPTQIVPVTPTQPQPTVIYVYPTTTEPETATIVNIEESTTAANEPISSVYSPEEYTTTPIFTKPTQSSAEYAIEDETPTSIGSKAPIGFILVLVLVIVVSGGVIIMVYAKKKEEDFIN